MTKQQQQQARMTDAELASAQRTIIECYYPTAEHTVAERLDRLARVANRLLGEVLKGRQVVSLARHVAAGGAPTPPQQLRAVFEPPEAA